MISRERRICFLISIIFTTGVVTLCFLALQSPIAIAVSLSLVLVVGGLTPGIATYWENKGIEKAAEKIEAYVSILHRIAKDLTTLADIVNPKQVEEARRVLLKQAFDYEKEVALIARMNPSQPTLSVLHESAASLAVELEYYTEARNLITYALAQSPPHDIKEELEDLEKVIKCRISNSS